RCRSDDCKNFPCKLSHAATILRECPIDFLRDRSPAPLTCAPVRAASPFLTVSSPLPDPFSTVSHRLLGFHRRSPRAHSGARPSQLPSPAVRQTRARQRKRSGQNGQNPSNSVAPLM